MSSWHPIRGEVYESLFGDSTPGVSGGDFGRVITLGTRLVASVDGRLVGLKFYQDAADTEKHLGAVWLPNGTLLSWTTFPLSYPAMAGTPPVWRRMWLHPRVELVADTEYIASVTFWNGGYWRSIGALADGPITSGHLTAPQDSMGAPNMLYIYDQFAMPTNTYQSTAYGVDVLFSPSTA